MMVNWFGLLEALSSSYRIRGIFFSGFREIRLGKVTSISKTDFCAHPPKWN